MSGSTRSSSQMTAAFNERAIVHGLYHNLTNLSDILALRCTSHLARELGTEIVMRRFDHVVEPFVRSDAAALRHTMHIAMAVITGSCTMQMMTGEGITPNNLNLLVAEGGTETLQNFLVQTLHYRRIHHGKAANYAFQDPERCFATFGLGSKSITVTEATSEGLFNLVLSAHTTADMIIMTAGGLAVFYPAWTKTGITVANHTLVLPATGQRIGCMKYPQWELKLDTNFLNGPCGKACPSLWRKVADRGEQIEVLEWDSVFSIKALLERSNAIWRLAIQCENQACVYSTSNNNAIITLPPDYPATDVRSIQRQELSLQTCIPVSDTAYIASTINAMVADRLIHGEFSACSTLHEIRLQDWWKSLYVMVMKELDESSIWRCFSGWINWGPIDTLQLLDASAKHSM
ncbi:hypothetical protein BD769DRAFT_1387499 [Suillus cothurnatus]|nr:hypothetical protein BD769DRAFT_1387499 [Suillus cothurnatus]